MERRFLIEQSKQYIARLRGVNISGKNRVPMAERKANLKQASFLRVRIWINSGNSLFFSQMKDSLPLQEVVRQVLLERFQVDAPVQVILAEDFLDALEHAPKGWGEKREEIVHDLSFVIPPVSPAAV